MTCHHPYSYPFLIRMTEVGVHIFLDNPKLGGTFLWIKLPLLLKRSKHPSCDSFGDSYLQGKQIRPFIKSAFLQVLNTGHTQ